MTFRFVVLLFFVSGISQAQDTTRLSVTFVGDIMQHDSQIAAAYDTLTKGYNYHDCFQYVKPVLDSADLTIGNLELTLAGPPYKGYPQFSAPDELLTTLKDSGFDVLVTANNHCEDRGRKGLERTIVMLDSFKIAHTGTFADTVDRLNDYPLIVRQNDFSLAFLNYTYGTNGMPVEKPNMVNFIDTTQIKIDLMQAKLSNPDVIVVFFHWGLEYQSQPSKFQKNLADFCFRHGAKLVIGAHPHVLQPMEWRKDSDQLIAYSLGNFVSGQRKRYTDGGAILNVQLEKIVSSDSSSQVSIRDANYQLEWIYKTGRSKKFYILPAEFETMGVDSVLTVPTLPANDKKAFDLFMSDSRSLLNKFNLNVPEKAIRKRED